MGPCSQQGRLTPSDAAGRAVAAVVLTAMATMAACSSSPAPRPSTTTITQTPVSTSAAPPSSTPPTVGVTAGASADVLMAYRGYWAARVAAQAAPDGPVPPELDTYAIDKARTDVKASVLRFRQQGIAFRGEPVLSPTVTAVRVGDRARASIADCVDSTRWTPVFVASGRSALAPGQSMRVVVDSTARMYDGRWVIDSSVAHRDRPC